jgi:hypothetical protein
MTVCAAGSVAVTMSNKNFSTNYKEGYGKGIRGAHLGVMATHGDDQEGDRKKMLQSN